MTQQTNGPTIHTIAVAWEYADSREEALLMDRDQAAAQLRALLKLPAEPVEGERISTKVWEAQVAAPFRAAYRLAYIERREKAGVEWNEKDALNAARQALHKLKGRAKITAEAVMEPAATGKTKTKVKAKGGRPKTTYTCPCCKATLSIEGRALVKAAKQKATAKDAAA